MWRLLLFGLLYLAVGDLSCCPKQQQAIFHGRNIGTFLQYTDIHYDKKYQPKSRANCHEFSPGTKCCRNTSIGDDPIEHASEWGDLRCDLPFKFIDESLKWASTNLTKPDFIMENG